MFLRRHQVDALGDVAGVVAEALVEPVEQGEPELPPAVTSGPRRYNKGGYVTGTLNGVFIRQIDIPKPVTDIVAVASQVGERLFVPRGFRNVRPVAWKVLGERGIPIRGMNPKFLPLNAQPDLLPPGRRHS